MELTIPNQFQNELITIVPNLRSFAMTLTRNHSRADDLMQEALAKAWKNESKFTIGTNLSAWVFTILRNTFLSDLRKRKAEVEDPDGAFTRRLTSRGEQEGHMEWLDFKQALGKLSAEQRQALVLIGEGYSYIEVALLCGCPVGTVKSRVNRSRARLRDLLSL